MRNRIYDAEYMKKYREDNKHTGNAFAAHAKWYEENSNKDGALNAGVAWSEFDIELLFKRDELGKLMHSNRELTKILRRSYASIAQARQKHKGRYE